MGNQNRPLHDLDPIKEIHDIETKYIEPDLITNSSSICQSPFRSATMISFRSPSAFVPPETNNSCELEPKANNELLEVCLLPLNLCQMNPVRSISDYLQPDPVHTSIHQASIYATFSAQTSICTWILLRQLAYTHFSLKTDRL